MVSQKPRAMCEMKAAMTAILSAQIGLIAMPFQAAARYSVKPAALRQSTGGGDAIG